MGETSGDGTMASAGYCTAGKELNFLRNLMDRNESIEHAKQSQSRDLALSGKLKQAMRKSMEIEERQGRVGRKKKDRRLGRVRDEIALWRAVSGRNN